MNISGILDIKERHAKLGGGIESIKTQHSKNKLTARERLEVLLDPNSFVEFDKYVEHRCTNYNLQKYTGDGVVTGYGTINGRTVVVCAQDFTVLGGSLGEMQAKKINKMQELALKMMSPIIFINDSGGARIQEGVDSLAGYGEIFQRNVNASGVVPQISLIMGPCAGGAAYSPSLTDFIFMVSNTSYMYITGPEVVKAAMHEDISHSDLGGPEVHASKSGICDFICEDEIECLQKTRRLIDFLPTSNTSGVPIIESSDPADRIETSLNKLVPDKQDKPYNMLHLINKIVDDGDFMQIKEEYAPNIITGFCRLEGRTVGIIANQPTHLAGCIDVDASIKGARFVRFCDAFNIPIVTLVDVPGFMPGKIQEHTGIIRHGAKLLYAYAEATAPKITVIVRKAYGGAYIVMGSKHLSADMNYSWPQTSIAVLGAKGAVSVLYRKKNLDENTIDELIKDYEARFNSPLIAASRGYIDNIIHPYQTRSHICASIAVLEKKKVQGIYKKHHTLPL